MHLGVKHYAHTLCQICIVFSLDFPLIFCSAVHTRNTYNLPTEYTFRNKITEGCSYYSLFYSILYSTKTDYVVFFAIDVHFGEEITITSQIFTTELLRSSNPRGRARTRVGQKELLPRALRVLSAIRLTVVVTTDHNCCQLRKEGSQEVSCTFSPPPPMLVHNKKGGCNLASLPWSLDDLVLTLPRGLGL